MTEPNFNITKEVLEQRRADYKARLDQMTADANALVGAIGDIDFWLEYMLTGWQSDLTAQAEKAEED